MTVADMCNAIERVSCRVCVGKCDCGLWSTERRCCEDCAAWDGYLMNRDVLWVEHLDIPNYTASQVPYLKHTYGWDATLGFWSPQGCKLPRKWRSPTCNGYLCKPARKRLGLKTSKARTRYIAMAVALFLRSYRNYRRSKAFTLTTY